MKTILLLGATGRTGAAVMQALPSHVTVRAAIRDDRDVERLVTAAAPVAPTLVDVTDATSLHEAAAGCDVVVNAIRLRDEIPPDALVDLHRTIADAALKSGTSHIAIVGGAGALHLPHGRRLWQSPKFPPQTLPRGRAHAVLRDHLESHQQPVPWTYLIPPAQYDPSGAATGRYAQTAPSIDESDFAQRAISYTDFGRAMADVALHTPERTQLVSWP